MEQLLTVRFRLTKTEEVISYCRYWKNEIIEADGCIDHDCTIIATELGIIEGDWRFNVSSVFSGATKRFDAFIRSINNRSDKLFLNHFAETIERPKAHTAVTEGAVDVDQSDWLQAHLDQHAGSPVEGEDEPVIFFGHPVPIEGVLTFPYPDGEREDSSSSLENKVDQLLDDVNTLYDFCMKHVFGAGPSKELVTRVRELSGRLYSIENKLVKSGVISV